MKLSVIVPVYNVENYIQKCMVSLLNQSFEDYEILLIDDGSLDHSIEIATGIKHLNQNKVKVIKKKNGGLSDARNMGLKHAIGEFVTFIDSDDYINEEMFRKMIDVAESTDSDVVCCDMKYVYPDGQLKDSSAGDFSEGCVKELPNLLMINNSACNKIYRKELFNDLKFPVNLWYEDLATIPMVLYRAKKIFHLKETMYYYVQRETSIAHQINPRIFDIYKAIDMLDHYFRDSELPLKTWKTIHRLLILKHGAFLTTLRIKESPSWNERNTYNLMNGKFIKERVVKWFQSNEIKDYNLKNHIVFWMLRYDLSWILATILKGKQS